MSLLRLLPAFGLLALSSAALAEDKAQGIDLAAAVVGGFADGATVNVTQDPMVVARTGPGSFTGTAASGATATLVVTEFAPCVFDITFSVNGESFPVRLDMGLVTSVSFAVGGSMGLADPVKAYQVTLTGAEGLATRINDDGTTEPFTNSPSLATSLTMAELEAAAAELRTLCPAR